MNDLIELEVCEDCIQVLANGVEDVATSEAALNMEDHWEGYDLFPGNVDHGFSYNQCDGCGSSLAGDRYQAWAIKREES